MDALFNSSSPLQNLSEVAKQLDIGRSTIYRKLKIINE